MKKFIFSACVLFFCGTSASADADFVSRHRLTYHYNTSGQSQIEHQIFLTNVNSSLYASGYNLVLPLSTNFVTGRDSQGPLNISVHSLEDNLTSIEVTFNDQVVGRNKTLAFTLNYPGQSAIKNGQVWQIDLPKISGLDALDEYDLTLEIPQSFGQLAFMSPTPRVFEGRKFSFSKDQLTRFAVSAAFGDFQTFDFNLTYELGNLGNKSAVGEIAIPADTAYQRVRYRRIDPSPSGIRLDADGNWLASYKVDKNQTLLVVASGQVHLLADPILSNRAIDPLDLNKYLQPTQYWQSRDEKILRLAKNVKSPRDVYDLVTDTLSYNYSSIADINSRLGAVGALNNPRLSLCQEFTDLFIALSRAAGIPAREVNGYAHTTDSRIRPLGLSGQTFHAWPQYWDKDKKLWISVDPTWGHTTGGEDYFSKLDFEHFTFITRGLSDTSPAITVKNFEIKYATYQEFSSVQPNVEWKPSRLFFPFAKNTSQVILHNPSGQAIYQLPVEIKGVNLEIISSQDTILPVILPFSSAEIKVDAKAPFWPNFRAKEIEISVMGFASRYNIDEKHFIVWEISLGIIIAAIISALGWLTFKAWGLLVQKSGRSGDLRRKSQKS